MFVFEVFLLFATFLVNSFDFVVFLICDVTYVLNVWYALIRVLGRPARESMFPSIPHFGGVLRSSVFTEFLYFFFSIVEYISLRMFGDFDSLRRLGVLLRGILIWGFSFRVGLSVPLSHQRGMSCWTLFLAYVTWFSLFWSLFLR